MEQISHLSSLASQVLKDQIQELTGSNVSVKIIVCHLPQRFFDTSDEILDNANGKFYAKNIDENTFISKNIKQ
jgi:hypothetical protein